jgi:hypothetical protein
MESAGMSQAVENDPDDFNVALHLTRAAESRPFNAPWSARRAATAMAA